MKKKTVVTMVTGVVIGIFVGILISILTTPSYSNMTLIKTWDEIESGKIKNLDGTAPIGNGLYNAIDTCRRNYGVTSVEGRYNAKIVCRVKHQTFLLNDFEWVGRKTFKLTP